MDVNSTEVQRTQYAQQEMIGKPNTEFEEE